MTPPDANRDVDAAGVATGNDTALEIHDLTVAYHKKPVLWGVDLAVPRGRLVGIVGPNGAGKSTLIKAALGTVPALVAVGWGGLIMRRHLRTIARWVSPPLLAGNALIMLALASQRL